MKAHARSKLRRLAALFTVLALAPSARAGDAALAEALFQQGLELMEQGDYAAACPRLKESFAQDEATGTLLALALCHEQAGKSASAWATYADVIARAKRDGRPDREQAAMEKMRALEPQLSRLTIEIDAAAAAVQGLVVRRDGLAIGEGAWGAASPVDPGEHVVEATAPGKRRWSATVTIGPSADSQSVKVPLLEEEPPQAAMEPRSAREVPREPATARPAEADASSSGGLPLRTIGIVVGGVGIVGLGVSAYLGLRAMSLDEDSRSGPGACNSNDQCPPEGLRERESAVNSANAATVALIAGGVFTAAGVTLFLLSGESDSKPDSAMVGVTPVAGPGVATMLVHGRF